MVLVCLDLFLGALPSAGLFAKKQLSGSLLPPFLSECILLLHAMLSGWYHSHNSPVCPSQQVIPTTLSPHPWSGEAQHYPTPGILSLPTPSPELPVSDAAGNNFEANEQTHAQKRQWRQISTVCTKYNIILLYNKVRAVSHKVAASSSVLNIERKQIGENGFSCFSPC